MASGNKFVGVGSVPIDTGTTTCWLRRTGTLALAPTIHALLAIRAAVAASAAVILVSVQVDAAPSAAGLVRTTAVAAAATVALVGAEVHAPIPTSGLPLGAPVVGPGYPRN